MKCNSVIILVAFLFPLIGCVSKIGKTEEIVMTTKKQKEPVFILSSRFFHPRNAQDKASTVEAIKKFKPQRIDWIYFEKDEFIEIYQKYGLEYSLTLNPQIPDPDVYATRKFRIEDYDGNLYVAPWMRTWKIGNPNWGCVNNPGFYELFVKRGMFLAQKKPYALMVDDALFNARLKHDKLVGCFCSSCTEKFKDIKSKENPNQRIDIQKIKKAARKLSHSKEALSQEEVDLIKKYEDFQEKSVVDFFQRWRNEISKSYPKMIFLTNNYNGEWNPIYSVFDGGIAEVKESMLNDENLAKIYQRAEKLNKTQLVICSSPDDETQMKLMLFNIQHDIATVLPWDILIVKENYRYYMDTNKLLRKINEIQQFKAGK